MLDYLIELDRRLFFLLNGSNSLFWDGFMSLVTDLKTWLPVVLVLLYIVIKNNCIQGVALFILCLSLAILLSDQFSSSVCKPLFHRFRPSHDPVIMYKVDIVNGYRGGLYGFISSHAANTFAGFVFIALVVRNNWVTFTLGLWAVVDSYSRIYLGVHYPGDILCGASWGALVGWVAYKLHKHYKSKLTAEPQRYVSSEYTKSGFLLSDIYLFLCSIYITFICISIGALF